MNGWDRIPDTLKARVQVENYLRGLRPSYSYTTVIRLARMVELRGYVVGNTSMSLYGELAKIHPDFVDLNNSVLRELHYRRRRRTKPSMTLDEFIEVARVGN
jgi:hypothetical protein